MATIKEVLSNIMKIDGAMAVSIVDANNGFMLGSEGKGFDLEFASAANTELYRSQQKIMETLGIHEKVEDFLITIETQYHILYPIPHVQGTFVYFVMNKTEGTLALARRSIQAASKDLVL